MALTKDELFEILLHIDNVNDYKELMVTNKTIGLILNKPVFWQKKIAFDNLPTIGHPSFKTWAKLKDIEQNKIPLFFKQLYTYNSHTFNFRNDLTIIHSILTVMDKKIRPNDGGLSIQIVKQDEDEYDVLIIGGYLTPHRYHVERYFNLKELKQLVFNIHYHFKQVGQYWDVVDQIDV